MKILKKCKSGYKFGKKMVKKGNKLGRKLNKGLNDYFEMNDNKIKKMMKKIP